MRRFFVIATMLGAISSPALAADWTAVATALGKSGTEGAGGSYRIGLPRTDLSVTLDGIALKPTLALGSWVAFLPMGNKVMAMGDLVLTEDEVGPVMKKLSENGIEISALHNHLFHASPATFYMHIYGEGDGVKLATAIHEGLALSKTPFPASAAAAQASPPPPIDLDTAAIDTALGAKGSNAAGVYQVNIARSAPVKEHGMTLPVPMGASEALNFQPLGGGKAAITGDFMLTAAEVNPVLRALRENGIEVTALHNHMLTDEPRLFFMHFWAHDDLSKLLTGLKAALGHVAVKS
ncbi:MAG TPA: DUF1259 domain-containing protein [Rhizomicrobium sp.]|jgi:hypothetical protein|nr:DUF1259 domain-containing protein [Rhizomicrobium sp.]